MLTSVSPRIHSGIIAPALWFQSLERRVETYKFSEQRSKRCLMKNVRITLAAVFAIFVLLTSAVAQTGAIKATIPFDFTIAKQTFAAGEYKVAVQGTMLQWVRLDGAGSAFVQYNLSAHKKDVSPRLIFHRYGNRSFLSQAWITGAGHELFASPKEIEYARTDKQEEVVVLASALPR